MTKNVITFDALCGSTITNVIGEMIGVALAGDALVVADFNGVTVQVRADSDPDLIYRDWSRAVSGYTSKTVGPYPWPVLPPEVLAEDARIEAENERRRQERQAQYEAEAAAKAAATAARLASAPAMDVTDAAVWQTWRDNNTDGYGAAVIRYAETWARLMQAEIDAGATLEDVVDDASRAADTEGITGFMHGVAVHCLSLCWAHGDALRRWHNRQYGVGEDETGTVNPAILTVTPEPANS